MSWYLAQVTTWLILVFGVAGGILLANTIESSVLDKVRLAMRLRKLGGSEVSKNWQKDVQAFLNAMEVDTNDSPTMVPKHRMESMISWLREEATEIAAADEAGDMVGIVDGVADIIYIALNIPCALGVNMRPIWNIVQEANMAKAGGPKGDDGKQQKPPGWKGPEGLIREELKRQGAEL